MEIRSDGKAASSIVSLADNVCENGPFTATLSERTVFW
jgi:hypothetical protein